MKKKLIGITLIITSLIFFVGCEDAIERLPLDQLTVPTTFTTYSNVQTYSWTFYSSLGTYHLGNNGLFDRNEHSGDLMMDGRINNGSDWLQGRIVVPTNTNDWSDPYQRIRAVNIMLDNLDNSQMTDSDIRHWRSVGYFFRSLAYFELLKKYGGVPWVENAIDDGDTDVLFGPRNSRQEVAKNILENLQYAEQNIKKEGEGPGTNTVGLNAVRAILSRFTLFEGTWRKYHNIEGANEYLSVCSSVSRSLIDDLPNIHPVYDQLFNSNNLGSITGIILYKEYRLNEQTHGLNQWARSSESPFWDFTRKAMDLYLCTDGQTRWNSPLFEGDQDIYKEFRNRDKRLYTTVTPPYEVRGQIGGNNSVWEFTENDADREYIDFLSTLSSLPYKALPDVNWAGFVQPISPNFRDAGSQNIPWDPGYNVTSTGYKMFKYVNRLKVNIAFLDENDEPLFRIEETMLNYAEAMAELNQFTQEVADLTINKLRFRAGVENMDPSQIGPTFDPTRNPSVDPVLWEIRRERAIELMAEGFRFDDLRRWKSMDEATKPKLGMYIKSSEYNDRLPIFEGASEGYISREPTPTSFPDYYYLFPIPSNQIVLNPKLEQNPGW
jgi:hypothetical protein